MGSHVSCSGRPKRIPIDAARCVGGTVNRPGTSRAGHRSSTTDKGRASEERAERFLIERGYEIVERNARSSLGELDLIALEGGDLVFVEVRSRADGALGRAEDTVGGAKQRRVARVAEAYLLDRRLTPDTCRFDVVAITGDEIELYKDA